LGASSRATQILVDDLDVSEAKIAQPILYCIGSSRAKVWFFLLISKII